MHISMGCFSTRIWIRTCNREFVETEQKTKALIHIFDRIVTFTDSACFRTSVFHALMSTVRSEVVTKSSFVLAS